MRKYSILTFLATVVAFSMKLSASPVMVNMYDCYVFVDPGNAQSFSDSLNNNSSDATKDSYPLGSMFKIRYFLGGDELNPSEGFQGFSLLEANPDFALTYSKPEEFGTFVKYTTDLSDDKLYAEGQISMGPLFGSAKYKVVLTDTSVQKTEASDLFGSPMPMVCYTLS